MHLFSDDIFPKFHFVDVGENNNQPIIILEDLTKRGYKPLKYKLSEQYLERCMILLAVFHANTFRLQKKNDVLFSTLCELWKRNDEYIIKQRKEQIRAFLESSIMTTLDDTLKKRIKQKLKKVECLKTEIASTIIHGCFTRSKVFMKDDIKYGFGIGDIKLIDFDAIQYDSPSIDFGRIFLTNLPNEDNVSKLERYFCSMMDAYLERFKCTYPEMNSTLVKQEIIHNLILSYINLSYLEKGAISNHISILHMFNKIGSFD
ncbi:hypothetical protein X777_04795 [Ooceraea biroi]|nr:hypothetical protein X777_04795 [Ooceraea biroi]